jgi:NADH-quinone oxidoreductase subunit L
VIHALAGEQDLRKMGGLKDDLPVTYWTFLIGAIAIAGVPGFAGFFSKDEILSKTFTSGHTLLWAVGLLTSLLTAIYMFRVVFMAFYGAHHEDETASVSAGPDAPHAAHALGHLHDAPPAMAVVLIVLAIGSVVAGYVGLGGRFERFLEPSFAVSNEAVIGATVASSTMGGLDTDAVLMAVSIIVAFAGIGIAAYYFLKNCRAAARMAARFAGVRKLLVNKYYVDEIYDTAVVQPVRIVSEDGLWKRIDVGLVDGAVNAVGRAVGGASQVLRRIQTGSVRTYAASLFFGVVLIIGYYLWR